MNTVHCKNQSWAPMSSFASMRQSVNEANAKIWRKLRCTRCWVTQQKYDRNSWHLIDWGVPLVAPHTPHSQTQFLPSHLISVFHLISCLQTLSFCPPHSSAFETPVLAGRGENEDDRQEGLSMSVKRKGGGWPQEEVVRGLCVCVCVLATNNLWCILK